MSAFKRCIGLDLKRAIGVSINQEEHRVPSDYGCAHLNGQVVVDEDSGLNFIMPLNPTTVNRRCMIVVNPAFSLYGIVHCPIIVEVGDDIMASIKLYDTDRGIVMPDWAFRVYLLN